MLNKTIRYILDLDSRAHIGANEYENVSMFPICDRVRQLKLNHMFRIKIGQCPEYLKTNYTLIGDTDQEIRTRASRNNFFLPRVVNQGIYTFRFSAIKEWNRLPTNIKDLTNSDSFKTSLKGHIFIAIKR